MTGPYQPQQPGNDGWGGGDPNSPFGASDPNSPFSPPAPASDGTGADEPSPYEGIQYQLDSPAQPPMSSPPAAYQPVTGPPQQSGPPQYQPQPGYPMQQQVFVPPPQPQRSNTGVIVGSLIGAVVVLALIVGVVVVATSGDDGDDGSTGTTATGEDGDGSGTDGDGTDTAGSTHAKVSDPCTDFDYSPFESIMALEPDPSSSTETLSEYTMQSCYGSMGSILDDEYAFYSVYAYFYTDSSGAASMYSASSYSTDGCDLSNPTGAWEEATLGTGDASSCSIGFADRVTVLVVHDGNLYLTVTMDATTGLDSGAVDAVTAVAENVLSTTAQ